MIRSTYLPTFAHKYNNIIGQGIGYDNIMLVWWGSATPKLLSWGFALFRMHLATRDSPLQRDRYDRAR